MIVNQNTSAPRRSSPLSCLLGLSLLVGCQNSPSEMNTPDLANPNPNLDLSGPAEAKPKLVAISADGHDRFFGVAFDPQGNFYATGTVADGTAGTADFKTVVAKFNAAGELDKTFGANGYAIHNVIVGAGGEHGRSIIVQPSGKLVVVGPVEHMGATDTRDRDIALARFNANGTLDTTFGTGNGVTILDLSAGELVGSTYVADNAWGLTGYSDGRLLVHGSKKRTGGTDTDFALIRLSADGVVDMTFGMQGTAAIDINNRSASPRSATLLADGSIIGTGYMNDGGPVKAVLYKLNSSGQIDTTFGVNGFFINNVLTATTEAYAAVLQGTSFVTAGYGRNDGTESIDWVSLRITAAGTLDPTYGTGGYVRIDNAGFDDNSRALAVLPDNRLLLVGGGRTATMNSDAMIAVLTPNGAKDTTFSQTGTRLYDLGGSSDFFWGAAVSPDKSIAALVGTKAILMGDAGNDDAAIMVLPLAR